MVRQRALRFPAGFLWGTASSAYQCEGGNTNSQWYRWEQQGHILSREHCEGATDWWRAAERDFELAEQMENNALRFSIEWSRIEPQEGRWDSLAIERYRVMLLALKQRHITPIITLHHFTEPLWFTDRGGFADAENIVYFTRYVAHVVKELQDLCNFWITINEPNVYALEGYYTGQFPPGEHDLHKAFLVLRNMMQAHIEAFYVMRRLQPQALISYCLQYRLFDPANPLSPLDRSVSRVQETFFNWAVLHASETGRFTFPANAFLPPLARAIGARDYHGVNYYTRDMMSFDVLHSEEAFGRRIVHPSAIHNDPGLNNTFGEIYPLGIYKVLCEVYKRTRGNKPIYITANGFSDTLDDRRPRAILEHLAMIHRAIREGIPVRGYFHWTLVDNFEWTNGWFVRLGLIELDPRTQRRTPRRSASMFGEICRANAVTEAIVDRYAPSLIDSIFGSPGTANSRLPV